MGLWEWWRQKRAQREVNKTAVDPELAALLRKVDDSRKMQTAIIESSRLAVVLAKRVAMKLKTEGRIDEESAKEIELAGLGFSNLKDSEQREYREISTAYNEEWEGSSPEKRAELEWRIHHWGKYMVDGFSPKEADERARELDYEFWVGMKPEIEVEGKIIVRADESVTKVLPQSKLPNGTVVDAGLAYITVVRAQYAQILDFLEKEGVPLECVIDDWIIHRVVKGKVDPRLRRKPKTLFDGLSWVVVYERDFNGSISAFVEEAFARVGEERFLRRTYERLSMKYSNTGCPKSPKNSDSLS